MIDGLGNGYALEEGLSGSLACRNLNRTSHRSSTTDLTQSADRAIDRAQKVVGRAALARATAQDAIEGISSTHGHFLRQLWPWIFSAAARRSGKLAAENVS